MIEEYLMKQAKEITPELEWTVNYVTGMEATGTVYDTGGSNGDINNDAEIRYPTYQFWIRSSKEDWDLAKKVAYRLYKQFHKKAWMMLFTFQNSMLRIGSFLCNS